MYFYKRYPETYKTLDLCLLFDKLEISGFECFSLDV